VTTAELQQWLARQPAGAEVLIVRDGLDYPEVEDLDSDFLWAGYCYLSRGGWTPVKGPNDPCMKYSKFKIVIGNFRRDL